MQRALRFRFPIVATAAAATTMLGAGAPTGDLAYFLEASRTLFSPAWADTFSDPGLQAGPVLLAVLGAGDIAASALGLGSDAWLTGGVAVALAVLVVVVAGRLLSERGEDRRSVELAAGLAAVALGLPYLAAVEAHPAQVAVPLLWVLAGLEARASRAWRAGALVGISAGLETWGMLGAPVLLLAPRATAVARAGAVAVAAVAGLFAPFGVLGDFRMLDYAWEVLPRTVPALVLEPGSAFPWGFRVGQGALAIAAGAAVALGLRRSEHAVWAAPLAAVAARLALDPVLNPWYWLAPETLVLVGAAALASHGIPALRVALRPTT